MSENIVFTVTQFDQFKMLNNIVGDNWFELDEICYDETNKVFNIKYKQEKIQKSPKASKSLFNIFRRYEKYFTDSILRVHDVNKLEIIDEAKIGRYDFGEIKYNDGDKLLVISSNFPLKIELSVASLYIEVVENEQR